MADPIVRPGRKLPFIENVAHLTQHADNWTRLVTGTLNSLVEEMTTIIGGDSRIAENTVEVFEVSDFPEPQGDVIIPPNRDLYIIKAPIQMVERFELPSDGVLQIESVNHNVNTVVYVGSDEYFSTVDDGGLLVLFLNRNTIIAVAPGATLFNIVGSNISKSPVGVVSTQIEVSLIGGFTHLGRIENTSIFWFDSIYQGFTTGLVLENCVEIVIQTVLMVSDFTSPGPIVTIKGDTDRSNISSLTFIAGPGQQGFRIDPAIPNTSRLQIINAAVRGGGDLFDTSGISGRETGTFTAVADASIASTGIASVSSSSVIPGGTAARFNHSGTDVFIGQIVTVSGYTSNTNYNTTAKVVATGSGYFELYDTLFSTDEAGGSYSSNSVTLTETGTDLLDGDTLTIDTDSSIDYDGGTYVYNVQTNSFQINAEWTSSMSGEWSTSGLDETDPRILLSASPDFGESTYVGCGIINGNDDATTTGINDTTFVDINFGTGAGTGTGLLESSTISRWKVIDAQNGTYMYFGNEPFSGPITFDVTLITDGNKDIFVLKYVVSRDGGAFEDFVDVAELSFFSDNNKNTSSSKTVGMRLSKGDAIKPQIRNMNDISDTVFVTDFTFYARQ